MTLAPTLSLADAGLQTWDVAVIGAGPAGATAAQACAGCGWRTLLIEAKCFPRRKSCGGCLSHRAVQALEHAGLGGVLQQVNARPIQRVQLKWRQSESVLNLPHGYVIERERFDAALVEAAIRAKAEFLPETSAAVETARNGCRHVVLTRHGQATAARARVVIAADGLLRSSLRHDGAFSSGFHPRARIGAATVVCASCSFPSLGTIAMMIAEHGYAGMVRLDRDRVLVAAALDAQTIKNHPVSAAVTAILASCDVQLPAGLRDAEWITAPRLTRHPQHVAGERLFMIGDAAGYVEPFTGDGMASAIESAIAVTPLAAEACQAWRPALAPAWCAAHQRIVRRRQGLCRGLAWALRRPWASRGLLAVCRHAPRLTSALFARAQRGPPVRESQEHAVCT